MKYIIAVLILLAAIPSWASTTVLGDGEYATVSAAYSASSPGDTLVIPSGSWVWSSQLVITKGLTIQGAGRTLTTITSNYDASDPTNTFAPGNFLIVYQPDETERAADNLIRITGITLDLNNKCGGIGLFNVTTTPTTKLRIDNCTIKNATNPSGSMRGIMLRGHIWGVIDSNVFQENYKSIDSYGYGRTSWDNFTFSFGSSQNIYYEDNVFEASNNNFAFHSCGDGGRYAARHNAYNWNGTTGIAPVFDAHGNEGVGGNYASMGTEVSYNLITSTNNESIRIEDARGGKHLVNNNDAITTSGVDMTTKEEFSDDCNPTNNGSATSDGEPQHVSGTYFWGNTKNGSTPVNATIAIECSTTTCSVQNCLAENVDFFNTTYSYTPYTYPHPLRVHTTTYVPWVH